jgi:F-type H+-transporting ATPase subunit epsilon
MHLKIISLKGIQFDGEAVSVNAKTASGEITVLDHHRPLITVLAEGNIAVTDPAGAVSRIPIVSGFLEVDISHDVTVLAD